MNSHSHENYFDFYSAVRVQLLIEHSVMKSNRVLSVFWNSLNQNIEERASRSVVVWMSHCWFSDILLLLLQLINSQRFNNDVLNSWLGGGQASSHTVTDPTVVDWLVIHFLQMIYWNFKIRCFRFGKGVGMHSIYCNTGILSKQWLASFVHMLITAPVKVKSQP